jgi:hypothetical protein
MRKVVEKYCIRYDNNIQALPYTAYFSQNKQQVDLRHRKKCFVLLIE